MHVCTWMLLCVGTMWTQPRQVWRKAKDMVLECTVHLSICKPKATQRRVREMELPFQNCFTAAHSISAHEAQRQACM